jgi:hypothetical protein
MLLEIGWDHPDTCRRDSEPPCDLLGPDRRSCARQLRDDPVADPVVVL